MYPTREEILAEKPEFLPEIIETVKTWKTLSYKGWKNKTKAEKIDKLKNLIGILSYMHNKEIPKIKLDFWYAYNPKKKIIYLKPDNPSIVSTLHELAHYLFDADEYLACRWSIWLFKECFFKTYIRMKWKNHLLVKT